ncbi:hypothetical protein EH31_13400 [Erythrobacter longus]|uniref:Uncharacterized protein n=1 Tax=Erythrobacter longus TaxID=1044 RepID=A0A074MTS8_ERYLO|nr:hypothetical protein EH31_13400 [Erythrobacter longus]
MAGVAAPLIVLWVLAQAGAQAGAQLGAGANAEVSYEGAIAPALAPLLSLGMMGVGMIGAAVTGRLWVGTALAAANAAFLAILAIALGLISAPFSAAAMITVIAAVSIAGFSFSARGALFTRSASPLGWLVAVGVVAGEAAILVTAFVRPGALPDWLLALLPAQWASIALQSALGGNFTAQAFAAMAALLGTAAATLLVTYLWPRRWTYSIMFTTWLALSALVWSSAGLA